MGGERAAERHCGRATLMCEVGNRARPDRRRRIGDPRILMWGLGGAAAGFLATTAARRVRTGPTLPLAPILLRQPRQPVFRALQQLVEAA